MTPEKANIYREVAMDYLRALYANDGLELVKSLIVSVGSSGSLRIKSFWMVDGRDETVISLDQTFRMDLSGPGDDISVYSFSYNERSDD